jgi:hypothetical protein
MMIALSRHLLTRAAIGAFAALLTLHAPAVRAAATATGTAPRSPEEIVRLGERMYREGLLPSGEPMRAIVKGDIEVEGSAFSCESCHMRSGLGSFEGLVTTPPTNAMRIFKPRKKYYKGIEIKYNEPTESRGEYTDESLAILIGSGVDPSGKAVNDVMPYYLLEAEDMATLIAYLRTLSAEFSPGVTDTTLHFATVVSEDVPAAERTEMVDALETYIDFKNRLREDYRRNATARDRMMALAMVGSKEVEPRTLTLSQWVLRGPPETWRAQLEEYDRTDPAFALLGGIVTGEWRPIHEFCEDNRIPCIFPNTDLPVVSDGDWYTLYLSKGYYQEGEAVARYLHRSDAAAKGRPILQIVRDTREGRALAAGFETTWLALGHEPPTTVPLAAGQALTPEALRRSTSGGKPAAIALWDSGTPESLSTLAGFVDGNTPGMLFVSARYLGESLWSLPDHLREAVSIAYPYRLPQEKIVSPMGDLMQFRVPDSRIAKHAYALVEVLKMAVMQIKGNYHRDYLLDAISMSMDQTVPLYERLSFGPGQRYASKGCGIVQLSRGAKPELVRKSESVIH